MCSYSFSEAYEFISCQTLFWFLSAYLWIAESVCFEHFNFPQRNGEFSFILPRVISMSTPKKKNNKKSIVYVGSSLHKSSLGKGAAPEQSVIPEHTRRSTLVYAQSPLPLGPSFELCLSTVRSSPWDKDKLDGRACRREGAPVRWLGWGPETRCLKKWTVALEWRNEN